MKRNDRIGFPHIHTVMWFGEKGVSHTNELILILQMIWIDMKNYVI